MLRVSCALSVVFLLAGCERRQLDGDAGPRADAAPLTVGQICDQLTEPVCQRTEQCFGIARETCRAEWSAACCEDRELCDVATTVTPDVLNPCIAAVRAISCDDLQQQNFPDSCPET